MNFIYSLVLWALLFIGVTIGKGFATHEDLIIACTIFQIIFTVAFVGFLITSFFYQLDWSRTAQRLGNTIKLRKKQVVLEEDKYKELKADYEKQLGEDYPNMEKEIFGKIAESQPNELIALLQSYPELKSSLTINTLVEKTTYLVGKIYDRKEDVEIAIINLENIKADTWLLFTPKVTIED